MAKLWIARREGLRLVGAIIGEVPLERAVARLDIAPWRLFTTQSPEVVPYEEVSTGDRKRALLEVAEPDRYELCGLILGFFESPYSAEECIRRLDLGSPRVAESSAR